MKKKTAPNLTFDPAPSILLTPPLCRENGSSIQTNQNSAPRDATVAVEREKAAAAEEESERRDLPKKIRPAGQSVRQTDRQPASQPVSSRNTHTLSAVC